MFEDFLLFFMPDLVLSRGEDYSDPAVEFSYPMVARMAVFCSRVPAPAGACTPVGGKMPPLPANFQ